MELDSYALVLLRSGPRAQDFADDELVRLQEAHLGHLRSLRNAGKLVASGPFSDQPDETLRGLCLYACGIAEASDLAEGDPSVRAGRLAVEVMTWWTPKDSVRFQPA
jgi:uncharacterized protein YciI